MPSPRPCALAALVLTSLTAGAVSACGGGEERVALAISSVAWASDGALELRTECADIDEDPRVTSEGDEPPTVTIWGSPRIGTCEPTLRVELAPGVTKVVDAATSEVVDLPPRP